jgi:hypothetical protein
MAESIRPYSDQPAANRVFLLTGPPSSAKTLVAREVARQLSGTYVDLLQDKLGLLQPELGLYAPKDFRKDVGTWSRDFGTPLILDEIEALFDTWTGNQQEDVFRLFAGLGGRVENPVLIVSRLSLPYKEILGSDKVFEVE